MAPLLTNTLPNMVPVPPSDERVMKLRALQQMRTLTMQDGSFSVRNVQPLAKNPASPGAAKKHKNEVQSMKLEPVMKASVAMQASATSHSNIASHARNCMSPRRATDSFNSIEPLESETPKLEAVPGTAAPDLHRSTINNLKQTKSLQRHECGCSPNPLTQDGKARMLSTSVRPSAGGVGIENLISISAGDNVSVS